MLGTCRVRVSVPVNTCGAHFLFIYFICIYSHFLRRIEWHFVVATSARRTNGNWKLSYFLLFNCRVLCCPQNGKIAYCDSQKWQISQMGWSRGNVLLGKWKANGVREPKGGRNYPLQITVRNLFTLIFIVIEKLCASCTQRQFDRFRSRRRNAQGTSDIAEHWRGTGSCQSTFMHANANEKANHFRFHFCYRLVLTWSNGQHFSPFLCACVCVSKSL